jgi:hypothetical protein
MLENNMGTTANVNENQIATSKKYTNCKLL